MLMALRRGFKSEAERIARRVRADLGISATQSVAPEHIAELLPRERFQELEDIQPDLFSACTLRPSPDRVVVVHNPLSPKTRQKSDVAHELAHTLLDHDLSRVQRLGDVTFLSCDPIQEEEAAWLSGCLLLPRALLLAEVSSGATARDIARKHGVSERMAQYRLDVTGVARQNRVAMAKAQGQPVDRDSRHPSSEG